MPRGVEQVLHAVWNAVQRTAIAAGGDLGVGLLRLRQRMIRRLGDHRPQLRIERVDALQVDAREPIGGDLLLFDPARELRHRGKRDVGVARGQRRRAGAAAHERVARRRGTGVDERRRPHRGGRHVWLEGDLARSRPPLEERRERSLPARSRQLAIRGTHRDLHQLFGFRERRRRHRRPDDRSRAEGRRRARRALVTPAPAPVRTTMAVGCRTPPRRRAPPGAR